MYSWHILTFLSVQVLREASSSSRIGTLSDQQCSGMGPGIRVLSPVDWLEIENYHCSMRLPSMLYQIDSVQVFT